MFLERRGVVRRQGISISKAALLGLAALLAATVMNGPAARADFLFNPTGGGASGAVTINGFDPLPGNALAKGGITAVNNALASGAGDTPGNQFLLYYQAALGSLLPASQNPAGLNQTFQITFTGVIREYVASVSTNAATFGVSANQTGAFLRMYQSSGVTYNDLNGTGFTAGNLILSATPIQSSAAGNFTNSGNNGPLDQHGANDWPGTTTVAGFGGSVINFFTNSANSSYFISALPTFFGLNFSSTQNLPFTTVDPSKFFFDGTASNVGSINGLSGPDLLIQADGNINVVPEPSSLCLTALGVAGVIAFARTKRARFA